MSVWQNTLDWFSALNPIAAATLATTGTWLLTALGASMVLLFRKPGRAVMDSMLGFTGGVMVAASFWSLLAPAIEMSAGEGLIKAIPAATGFLLGAVFLYGMDKMLPHMHINFEVAEGMESKLHKTTLLILAITLHNIPEGLAVGVLFGAAALGMEEISVASALVLAMGIGIQNFPEGFAVAMPMRRLGASRFKSFWYGQLSAIVEPLAGAAGAAAVLLFTPILPYALAFAAGAMIYVVVEEVIPETQLDKYTDQAVMGFMGGFVVMMILDVGLGA